MRGKIRMDNFLEILGFVMLVGVSGYFIANCDAHKIDSCGSACQKTGQKMQKYTDDEGCVCVGK